MRTAETILANMGYVESDPEISFFELAQLLRVVQIETIMECASLAEPEHNISIAIDIHESILKLLDQINQPNANK